MENGEVVHKIRNRWPKLSPTSFCVDGILPTITQEEQESGLEIEDVIFYCSENEVSYVAFFQIEASVFVDRI